MRMLVSAAATIAGAVIIGVAVHNSSPGGIAFGGIMLAVGWIMAETGREVKG